MSTSFIRGCLHNFIFPSTFADSPPRGPLIQAALDRMKKRKAEHTGCGAASSCTAMMTAGAGANKKKKSIKGKKGKSHAESPNADSDGYKQILVNSHWRRIPCKNKENRSREEAATGANSTKQEKLRRQQQRKNWRGRTSGRQ